MINEIRSDQTSIVSETKAVATSSETSAPDTPSIAPALALRNLISGTARKTAKQMEKSAGLLEVIRNTGFTPFVGI